MSYALNQTVRLTIAIVDANNNPADPNSLNVVLTSPQGVATTVPYPASNFVRTGVGAYYCDVTLSAVGRWYYTINSIGADTGVTQGYLDVGNLVPAASAAGAPATILQIAQDAAIELSLQSLAYSGATLFPGAIDEGDAATPRLVRSLQKTCETLAANHSWQAVKAEWVFGAYPREVQVGAIPFDFLRFTTPLFDRTRRYRAIGPLTSEEWQQLKAIPAAYGYFSWMRRGNDIHLWPVPENGHTFAFEYISTAVGFDQVPVPNPPFSGGAPALTGGPNWGVGAPTAGLPQPRRITRFSADANVPLWDSELVTLGVIANYLGIEGGNNTIAAGAFQSMMRNRLKNDRGVKSINMGGLRDPLGLAALRRAASVITISSTGS